MNHKGRGHADYRGRALRISGEANRPRRNPGWPAPTAPRSHVRRTAAFAARGMR